MIRADMAWPPTARPKTIQFSYRVPRPVAHALLDRIDPLFNGSQSKPDVQIRALRPVTDPAGHFYVSRRITNWFLRVTRGRRKDIDLEDIAAHHLYNHNIRVTLPIFSGMTMDWRSHTYLISVYPLIKGRHFIGSMRDLITLGRAVRKMHHALRSFKYAPQVRNNAFRTVKYLGSIRRAIGRALERGDFIVFHERASWVKRHEDWLRRLVESFDPDIYSRSGSQCIHGELHIGNVIYTPSGQVIFTDFEETPDSWLPPVFDIAYIAHRFFMDPKAGRAVFIDRLRAFEKGYGPLNLGQLFEMMLQVTWRNVTLLLGEVMRRKSMSPVSEFDKFVRLERQTEQIMNEWTKL